MDPTPRNLTMMRALSAKGIRTFKRPLMPKARWRMETEVPLTMPDIEYETIDVEEWLAMHDSEWGGNPT